MLFGYISAKEAICYNDGYLTRDPIMNKMSPCWIEAYTSGQVTGCKLTSTMVTLVS